MHTHGIPPAFRGGVGNGISISNIISVSISTRVGIRMSDSPTISTSIGISI